MAVYKRAGSPYWWISLSVCGKRIRVSSKRRTYDGALAVEAALRPESLRMSKEQSQRSAMRVAGYEWDKGDGRYVEAGVNERKGSSPPRGLVPSTSVLYSRWRGAKNRATKYGVPFDLTIDDVVAIYQRSGGECELTGLPFVFSTTRGPWTPSLDRIDPSLGYTMSNCRMIVLSANQAIGKWGEEVLMDLAHALIMKEKADAFRDTLELQGNAASAHASYQRGD